MEWFETKNQLADCLNITTDCCYRWQFQTLLGIPWAAPAASSPHSMLEGSDILCGQLVPSLQPHPYVALAPGEIMFGTHKHF